MSTHIGDAWRAAGLLPIAMPFSVRNSTAPGPGRIRDFRHRLFGNHDVNRLGELNVEGFEEVHPTLFAEGDPPVLMTHMPLRHVPEGCVNVHGHTHNAAPTSARHVNVSVEQIRYQPVQLEKIRRLARELVADRYPARETTAERIDNMAAQGRPPTNGLLGTE